MARFKHLVAASAALATLGTLAACGPDSGAGKGAHGGVFTTVDGNNPITPGAPMNPFNANGNSFGVDEGDECEPVGDDRCCWYSVAGLFRLALGQRCSIAVHRRCGVSIRCECGVVGSCCFAGCRGRDLVVVGGAVMSLGGLVRVRKALPML